VVVTFATGFEPVTAQGGPAGGTTGTINGVSGVVTLSSGTYTFTRSVAGSAVAASVLLQFIPTIAFPYAPELIWAGANNFPYTAQILSDVEAMGGKGRGSWGSFSGTFGYPRKQQRRVVRWIEWALLP